MEQDRRGQRRPAEKHLRRREKAPAAPARRHQHAAARDRSPFEHSAGQHARPAAARLHRPGPGGRGAHQSALRRDRGGRHPGQLPGCLPHQGDRRSVPRPHHAAAERRRPRRHGPAGRHAFRRRRQDSHQGEAACRVQPPHHRAPAQQRLQTLRLHRHQPALLRKGHADEERSGFTSTASRRARKPTR